MSKLIVKTVTLSLLVVLSAVVLQTPIAVAQDFQNSKTNSNSENPKPFAGLVARLRVDSISRSQQTGELRNYDITPNRVLRNRTYEISVKARNCRSNELTGATLSRIGSTGLEIRLSESSECEIHAKLNVSKSAPLGQSTIRIQKAFSLLGNAYITVEDREGFDIATRKSTQKPKGRSPWIVRNWWAFPLIAGLSFGTVKAVQFVNNNSGYAVTCNDGAISHSGGKQGACSRHGGVR